MNFLIIVGVLALLLLIAGAVLKKSAPADDKSELSRYLSGVKDFTPAKEFMGVDGTSGIALDEKARKICLIGKNGNFSSRVFSHQEILSSEIAEDGVQIVKYSRRSMVEDSIREEQPAEQPDESDGSEWGAEEQAAFQNAPATVKKITLHVMVADTQNPNHAVTFSNSEFERGSVNHNISLAAARQWHSRLCILMQQADNEAEIAASQGEICKENPYVADEINKLAELMKSGFITEEEFNLQKGKLLR